MIEADYAHTACALTGMLAFFLGMWFENVRVRSS